VLGPSVPRVPVGKASRVADGETGMTLIRPLAQQQFGPGWQVASGSYDPIHCRVRGFFPYGGEAPAAVRRTFKSEVATSASVGEVTATSAFPRVSWRWSAMGSARGRPCWGGCCGEEAFGIVEVVRGIVVVDGVDCDGVESDVDGSGDVVVGGTVVAGGTVEELNELVVDAVDAVDVEEVEEVDGFCVDEGVVEGGSNGNGFCHCVSNAGEPSPGFTVNDNSNWSFLLSGTRRGVYRHTSYLLFGYS